jgi:hypothetical protein
MKFPKVSRKNLMFMLSAVIVIGFLFLFKTSYTEGFTVPAAPSTPYLDYFMLVGDNSETIPLQTFLNAVQNNTTKNITDIKFYALNSVKNAFNIELPRYMKNGISENLLSSQSDKMSIEFAKPTASPKKIQYAGATDSATAKLPISLGDKKMTDGLTILNANPLQITGKFGGTATNKTNINLSNLHTTNGYTTGFKTPASYSTEAGRNKNLLVRFIFN